ncbi:cytosine-specific methyltransferase [Brevibacillus reuszeri]|uniref:DNA cytosine methyltransferase n=1 Tax=Brevibacillus reuszeri TaxID=54915 RepID=UPI001AFCED4F|nr:DNA cytosine methyltransferase [Brevibacillus reuszeri]GIO09882.1 cytosine-specific methyltransferase [Brevibacillus reuszeri]
MVLQDDKYTVLDLFCGAGGMSEGFLQAGFQIPFASDYSKEAAETYKNRHRQLGYDLNFFNDDIGKLTKRSTLINFLEGKSIDVIVGGPPCQGFSLTGKRDENDPRNRLFLDYLKIVKIVKPKYFVIENVEGILSYRIKKITGISGDIYEDEFVPEIIKKEAEKFGYFVDHKLLNAKDYGVPQNRPRVIFFGTRITRSREKKLLIPNFPEKQAITVSTEDAISDLRFLKNGEVSTKYNRKYKVTAYQQMLRSGLTPSAKGETVKAIDLYNHEASKHQDKTVERFKKLNTGESVGQLLKRLSPEEFEYFNTKKYRCAKLERDAISPTVLTLPDDIIHYDPGNPRILTVREFARLQSFDDSFVFLGKRTTGGDKRKFETPQYTQVGNAVPPLFARAIAKMIMGAIKGI